MYIFQPNLVYIVSQPTFPENVWDLDGCAMTDAFDQICDAFNWWRQYLDIGFSNVEVSAIGAPEIETIARDDAAALMQLLNPHLKPPFTIFLGKRERQPYGWSWDGSKIFVAYNYYRQEIKTVVAHELAHCMGASHNGALPADIMWGTLAAPNETTMGMIGQEYKG